MSDADIITEGHREDMAFQEWVKAAPLDELQAQGRFAVGWQRVAIERELARRATL